MNAVVYLQSSTHSQHKDNSQADQRDKDKEHSSSDNRAGGGAGSPSERVSNKFPFLPKMVGVSNGSISSRVTPFNSGHVSPHRGGPTVRLRSDVEETTESRLAVIPEGAQGGGGE